MLPIHSSQRQTRIEEQRKKVHTLQSKQDPGSPYQLKTNESEPLHLHDFFLSRRFDIQNQPATKASLCSYEFLINDQTKSELSRTLVPEDKKYGIATIKPLGLCSGSCASRST